MAVKVETNAETTWGLKGTETEIDWGTEDLTLAQLKYMFKNTYQMENFPISFHQQIAQTLLFEMRYDSLPNYKKWPNDSS